MQRWMSFDWTSNSLRDAWIVWAFLLFVQSSVWPNVPDTYANVALDSSKSYVYHCIRHLTKFYLPFPWAFVRLYWDFALLFLRSAVHFESAKNKKENENQTSIIWKENHVTRHTHVVGKFIEVKIFQIRLSKLCNCIINMDFDAWHLYTVDQLLKLRLDSKSVWICQNLINIEKVS